MLEKRVSSLIQNIHSAALNSDQWIIVLQQLNDLFQGGGANFLLVDPKRLDVPKIIDHQISDEGEYLEHYQKIDPRLAALQSHGFPSVMHDYMHMSEKEIDKSEFYDWCSNFEMRYYCSLVAGGPEGHLLCMTVQRSSKVGPVSQSEVLLGKMLADHLAIAAKTATHIQHLKVENSILCDAIDKLDFGIIVQSDQGVTINVNVAAQEILNKSDGISLTKDGLLIQDNNAAKKLAQALDHFNRSSQIIRPLECHISVFRPSGQKPYLLLVSPFTEDLSSQHSVERGTVIFLIDPEKPRKLSLEGLSELFGLTPAEASLLNDLWDGLSLAEIAHIRGRSRETIKSQMSSVFSKTGTNRQAKVISLLSSVSEIIGER